MVRFRLFIIYVMYSMIHNEMKIYRKNVPVFLFFLKMKINCLFVQIVLSNMKYEKSFKVLLLESQRDKFTGNAAYNK